MPWTRSGRIKSPPYSLTGVVMGSMVHLSAGCIHIDWGKNRGYTNHGVLFQSGDEAVGPYRYIGSDSDEEIIEEKPCLCRSLGRIKPRLEILGYTLEACRSWLQSTFGEDENTRPSAVFEQLSEFLRSLPWEVDGPYLDFDSVVMGTFGVSLDTYVVLRVLAEIPELENLPIRWEYADIIEGGWVSPDEIVPGCGAQRCMIVTEGSSDVHVLKRSLQHLYPDIADFFDFIDMKDGNPFPGVGNLVTFCKGLARIGYSGHMLIVLDNDTAGRWALETIVSLDLSPNVKATTLPVLSEFSQFRTIGPSGNAVEDINGRACSIECFLDLSVIDSDPIVRWKNYNEKLKSYQGELVRKDDYIRAFRDQFNRMDTYQTKKLYVLWEHLIAESAMNRVIFPTEENW
ncbi:hypothetical protein FOC84_26640 [Achromobacter pestifer]|uniref:HEPN/Toprim N-terminal domain-containing protein n=1 Tax=Achromobacter pestifer TaxID=1353889 RepID=A0A7D4IBM7_9BURK|nr:HEPN/Toprim-associated domain-containing protein [Achromobacter pestifer]QKH38321.1 hypothetical protein FOC84_26640 [Achromobacter pestifer]